jgi:hypothetical protein
LYPSLDVDLYLFLAHPIPSGFPCTIDPSTLHS